MKSEKDRLIVYIIEEVVFLIITICTCYLESRYLLFQIDMELCGMLYALLTSLLVASIQSNFSNIIESLGDKVEKIIKTKNILILFVWVLNNMLFIMHGLIGLNILLIIILLVNTLLFIYSIVIISILYKDIPKTKDSEKIYTVFVLDLISIINTLLYLITIILLNIIIPVKIVLLDGIASITLTVLLNSIKYYIIKKNVANFLYRIIIRDSICICIGTVISCFYACIQYKTYGDFPIGTLVLNLPIIILLMLFIIPMLNTNKKIRNSLKGETL